MRPTLFRSIFKNISLLHRVTEPREELQIWCDAPLKWEDAWHLAWLYSILAEKPISSLIVVGVSEFRQLIKGQQRDLKCGYSKNLSSAF